MYRLRSSTLAAALAALFVLGASAPASAQKAKQSKVKSKSSVVRTSPRAKAGSYSSMKSKPSYSKPSYSKPSYSKAPSVMSGKSTAGKQSWSKTPSTIRYNRAPQQKIGSAKVYSKNGSSKIYSKNGYSKVRTTVRVNQAPQSKTKTLKIGSQDDPRELRSTVRVNKAGNSKVGGVTLKPTVKSNGKASVKSNFKQGDPIVIAKEKIANTVRGRAAEEDRRLNRDGRDREYGRRGYRDGYRYGYDGGYYRGYRRGYRDAYYYGYCYGFCYPYYRYYGPHHVFGYHYGGFGFYHGRWHFVLVLGSPYVHHHHHHYRYSWWDGHYNSLVRWDRAVEVHRSEYAFDLTGRTCVELLIRTTDGTVYEVKTDPRYWDARDPGDLYAALWSELEREGQLQIEDVNGAILVFPAGLIQQIEARVCN